MTDTTDEAIDALRREMHAEFAALHATLAAAQAAMQALVAAQAAALAGAQAALDAAPSTPNAETIAAMEAARRGEFTFSGTVEEFGAHLQALASKR